jgi:NAD dependent epimerase/dehydratase family enzyme
MLPAHSTVRLPSHLRNVDFTAVLAKTLHRPAVATVPKFALQVLFGETASVLLASARALPKAAENAGYRFECAELGPALADLV